MIKKSASAFAFAPTTNKAPEKQQSKSHQATQPIIKELKDEDFCVPPKSQFPYEIDAFAMSTEFYYHQPQNIAVVEQLGLSGLIYVLDWERIFPNDPYSVNEAELQFYEATFQNLADHGIKPIPILYHGNTPTWLELQGGASSRLFLEAFRFYARTVFNRLGKYSNIWFVSQENNILLLRGYLDDYCLPGKKSIVAFWQAFYHLTLAAAWTKAEFIEAQNQGLIAPESLLGIGQAWYPTVPFDFKDRSDWQACQDFDEYNVRLFFDPNILGVLPNCFYEALTQFNLKAMVWPGDLEKLHQYTLDLIGLNYHQPVIIAHPKRLYETHNWYRPPQVFFTDKAYVVSPASEDYTDWNWTIKPENLAQASKTIWKIYHKPLMIIENGLIRLEDKNHHFFKPDFQ